MAKRTIEKFFPFRGGIYPEQNSFFRKTYWNIARLILPYTNIYDYDPGHIFSRQKGLEGV